MRRWRSLMKKIYINTVLFWISLIITIPAFAFFKIPDTDFEANFSEAITYDTKSLLMKFNYKTNDLKIGPYTGTWKNRKSSSKFLMFGKRKTSTEINLVHEVYGTWSMFCSGILKEFEIYGFSFDRQNEIDYQCLMRNEEQEAVLIVLPFKKPKFSMGPPVENRQVEITLPDGREIQAESLHKGVGNKRSHPKPVGYKIVDEGRVVGGIGRFEKKNVILIGHEIADTDDAHLVFMSGLGLWFFQHNDRKSPLD